MVAMIGKKIKDNDFMCSQQIEKLEDLTIEELYDECKNSTQTCLTLKKQNDDLIKELDDIEYLKVQAGGLGVFAYSAFVLTGYKWKLSRKYKKVSEKLETAKEIDAINWAIYSQKKKEAELDGKELELVKE